MERHRVCTTGRVQQLGPREDRPDTKLPVRKRIQGNGNKFIQAATHFVSEKPNSLLQKSSSFPFSVVKKYVNFEMYSTFHVFHLFLRIISALKFPDGNIDISALS